LELSDYPLVIHEHESIPTSALRDLRSIAGDQMRTKILEVCGVDVPDFA
jgi:hypothetical protein